MEECESGRKGEAAHHPKKYNSDDHIIKVFFSFMLLCD
jgi:hypothetical protein